MESYLGHELQELLQPEFELQAALGLPQPRPVLNTPCQGRTAVVLGQGLNHALCLAENVHVRQRARACLLGQAGCRQQQQQEEEEETGLHWQVASSGRTGDNYWPSGLLGEQ